MAATIDIAVTLTIRVAELPDPPEGYGELRIVVRRYGWGDDKYFDAEDLQSAVQFWAKQGLEDCSIEAIVTRRDQIGWVEMRCDLSSVKGEPETYHWGPWYDTF